jgi:superfamily II DNA/RNA helicase
MDVPDHHPLDDELAAGLHGNLSQPQRDRNLAAFGGGSVKVLVATDVAARCVHADNVELVIQVDPPPEHKAYLHRSGGTALADGAGDVITIMLPIQKKDTLALPRTKAIEVTSQRVTPSSDAVTVLVAEVAAYVKPSLKIAPQHGGGQSTGANAQRKHAARGAS